MHAVELADCRVAEALQLEDESRHVVHELRVDLAGHSCVGAARGCEAAVGVERATQNVLLVDVCRLPQGEAHDAEVHGGFTRLLVDDEVDLDLTLLAVDRNFQAVRVSGRLSGGLLVQECYLPLDV